MSSLSDVAIAYAESRKEPWVRDGIERSVRVGLSREEYEWLEATAPTIIGKPAASAADLVRVLVLSAQQQLGTQHTRPSSAPKRPAVVESSSPR
jgi:hypothetical protein